MDVQPEPGRIQQNRTDPSGFAQNLEMILEKLSVKIRDINHYIPPDACAVRLRHGSGADTFQLQSMCVIGGGGESTLSQMQQYGEPQSRYATLLFLPDVRETQTQIKHLFIFRMKHSVLTLVHILLTFRN